MNFKSFVSFSLFFALSFSVVHEYVYSMIDTEHCDVAEYIAEIDTPSHHGDVCDIHFEYHQAFVLTEPNALASLNQNNYNLISYDKQYDFNYIFTTIKPPIA